MNCNIIKDLIPSYIDGISSEETVAAIEKHIEHCQGCKDTLQMMQQSTVQIVETNVKDAKEPFKLINKKRRYQVIIAILMTFILTIIGSLVVQDVGVVNQFFFPMVTGDANIMDDSEGWQSISFSADLINSQDYVIYDSLFWKKEIINTANNESDVLLRVKDEKGDVIIDEILIPLGKGVKLDGLKRKEKYFFEIKAPPGRFIINAV
ncbi:zf-HC2 domain-containing protein [Lysinibacillus xylanilyticus]|uniref:zf-HC2 domain-containing protein n=1 Tax=Lysinibacillus xylanilyticus TaxID=582475 RepID=UPI002B249DCC|nr:zf-HC2 domain-containing protein [Lysinibacillus xylanilyticus]MEB2301647.1 zf-HC2 domain-containing protein [Lysinibacillus xylanilyticus]